jgi:uncharacterized protein (TIGR00369 family)
MSSEKMNPDLIEPPYPLMAHLGFEIVDWRDGFARFQMPLAPFLMNRYGIPHGGVYATLLDTVMGYCGCFTGDPDALRMAMTLSLNVNYLSRPKGRMLLAEGCVTGGGRKTFFAEGKVVDETGEAIASGTGVFRYRGR